MTDTYLWSGQDRMLTVEDMENMPDDELRYELDDGVLIVSPGPVHAASAGSHPPGRHPERGISSRVGRARRRRRQHR